MTNATQTTQHATGDRRVVVARGIYKSQFAGRIGTVATVKPTAFGPLVTLTFDNAFHGIRESQFMPAELDPYTPDQDDEN